MRGTSTFVNSSFSVNYILIRNTQIFFGWKIHGWELLIDDSKISASNDVFLIQIDLFIKDEIGN